MELLGSFFSFLVPKPEKTLMFPQKFMERTMERAIERAMARSIVCSENTDIPYSLTLVPRKRRDGRRGMRCRGGSYLPQADEPPGLRCRGGSYPPQAEEPPGLRCRVRLLSAKADEPPGLRQQTIQAGPILIPCWICLRQIAFAAQMPGGSRPRAWLVAPSGALRDVPRQPTGLSALNALSPLRGKSRPCKNGGHTCLQRGQSARRSTQDA